MVSFLHVHSHQGKETFEKTAFSCAWSDMPSHTHTSQVLSGVFLGHLMVQPDQN